MAPFANVVAAMTPHFLRRFDGEADERPGRRSSRPALTPIKILDAGYVWTLPTYAGRMYDVSPDGQRFLMLKSPAALHCLVVILDMRVTPRYGLVDASALVREGHVVGSD